jgi:hypothetical protein
VSTTAPPPPRWGAVRRVLFRFAFVYLVLFIFPFPVAFPFVGEEFVQPYTDFWNAVVIRVGEHVFRAAVDVTPNGSGDRTYDYILTFVSLVLATAAAAVWTLLDRRRQEYVRLADWLRVYVRFFLASTMMVYGASKVIPMQFGPPMLDRLVQPFGESSPMGLLWTFMGASAGYTIFTGAGEMLGGLLLTTRRTTLLGALVCIGVLGHVAMLNFSYDVPVKLLSVHLLALAVYVAAPDLRRLAHFFLLNRPAEPANLHPLFRRKWLRRVALVLRTAFVVALVGFSLAEAYKDYTIYRDPEPRPPLYGIWVVEEFAIDGESRPPLVTDEARWRRVIVSSAQTFAVQLMSDAHRRYGYKLDEEAHTLALSKRADPAWKSTLTVQQPEPDRMLLEGEFDGRPLRAKLRRTAEPQFLLTSRGFHWINEAPFNR